MDEKTDGAALAGCNCFGMRKASRRISQYYDAHLVPSGLRATQYSILLLIRECGAQSINALAARLEMDRTTAGQNLRPLERDGLVAFSRSPTDGRSRNVSLTAAGVEALDVATPLWRDAQTAFEGLNGSDLAADLRARLATLRFG